MAVVTRNSNGYPDPNALGAHVSRSHDAVAFAKTTFIKIPVTNGDSINSDYRLARLPSGARLLPQSSLYLPAVAGLTSLSVGLDNRLGTKVAAALISAANVSAGGSFSLVSAVALADYGKRLWELLGLASDPRSDLDVYATVNAAPTASVTMTGFLLWTVPGV